MCLQGAKVIASAMLLMATVSPAMSQAASNACPPGTLLFGYGGSAGCIEAKTKQVVVKCFRQKSCPSGWRGAGMRDDRGLDLCCPPRPKPVFGETDDFRFVGCQWNGTAPFCRGSCPDGWLSKAASKDGKGMGRFAQHFGAPCVTGLKALCCRSALPGRQSP